MQAILYVNNSDNAKINKSLTTVMTTDVKLKDDTENINPVIILSPSISSNFNYVYLQDFDRYYFVNSMTYSQQKYIVNLGIDVLMSFKTGIYNLNVIANRSSSRFNLYQSDGEISFLAKNDIITIPFEHGFSGASMILAVNGGVNTNE